MKLLHHSQSAYSKLNFAKMLIISGFLLSGGALGLVVYSHRERPRLPLNVLTAQNAASSVKPTVEAIKSYNVPTADPKYISIPAIDVTRARILKLGLTTSNQIMVPGNIDDSGWYGGSSKPGQAGAMFIYGHVSSWQANGIFHDLKELKLGEKITVTRGDNTTYVYQVVRTKVYPYDKVDMAEVLAPIDDAKPGLNLMTCTGKIIKGTSEFSQRLVVFTSLVKS